jgi:hypothetical protein
VHQRRRDYGIAIKAQLTKVSAAKPRVLASYATFDATQDPKIAGLPTHGSTFMVENGCQPAAAASRRNLRRMNNEQVQNSIALVCGDCGGHRTCDRRTGELGAEDPGLDGLQR